MRHCAGILFVVIACLPYVGMIRQGASGPGSDTHADETLLVTSPHRREVRLEYSRGFREWMKARHARDVQIQWLVVGGTSKILKDLESRFTTSPADPGVDVMFGGGVAPFYTAIRHGWLVPVHVPADVLASIPASCAGAPVYDVGERWYGVALSGFGIIYNRVLVERMKLPVPVSWDDLGRPDYFSWLASGDLRSSGSVHMCYEIILQAYGLERGWHLLTRICANVRRFGEGGGVAPREVAAGEVAAGMVIDQYAQTVIDSTGADALAFVLPAGATVVNADPIAVIRSGPSPGLAALFVEYVLCEQGQRLLFQSAGTDGQQHSLHRLPVRETIYGEPGAPDARPYEYDGSFEYDTDLGSRRWRVVNDLVGVWLIDAHDDLAGAWCAVIEAGTDPALVDRLCALPVAAAEIEILARRWSDQRYRQAVMNKWAHGARSRYDEVASVSSTQ